MAYTGCRCTLLSAIWSDVTVNSDVLTSGNILGISGDRFAAYLVDLDTSEIQRIQNDFLPYNAEFTPDGKQLVFSAFSDNHIRIYDVETRQLLREWQSDQAGISALAVSPDGRTILTPSSLLASLYPVVNEWNFKTGELIRRYAGHDPASFLLRAEFQPDGKRFLSVATDGTVRVSNLTNQTALDRIGKIDMSAI